jgi:hypothetical protein
VDTAGNLIIPGNLTAANFSGTGGGISSVANIGATPNAGGASIAGTVLTLQPASATFGGVIISGNQVLPSGRKTFTDVLLSNLLYQFYDNGITTTTSNIAWGNGSIQAVAPNNSAALTFTFSPPLYPAILTLNVYAGVAGLPTFPASVHGQPGVTLIAGKNSIFRFFWDGNAIFYYIGGCNNQ